MLASTTDAFPDGINQGRCIVPGGSSVNDSRLANICMLLLLLFFTLCMF